MQKLVIHVEVITDASRANTRSPQYESFQLFVKSIKCDNIHMVAVHLSYEDTSNEAKWTTILFSLKLDSILT